jgi:hypothetical protein
MEKGYLDQAKGNEGASAGWEADVVEVGLLLPARQVAALEAVAHGLGLTAGELARRLLHDFLQRPAGFLSRE